MKHSGESGNSSSKKRTAQNNNTSLEIVQAGSKQEQGGVGWVMTKQGEDMVFTRKDLSPDQPGQHFTVPLSTLKSLKTGQGLPTGIQGSFLLKTSSGYQLVMTKMVTQSAIEEEKKKRDGIIINE